MLCDILVVHLWDMSICCDILVVHMCWVFFFFLVACYWISSLPSWLFSFMVSFDSCEGKMPLVLKSLSSRVLSSWIFHLPYKSMNHTKSDQCQNLGSIGLAKKFMRVFLCLLNGMFYRTNFLANHMRVCVCVYPLYMYVYLYI